jgi:hypothetical protein
MSEIQFRPIQGLQDKIISNPISRPGAVYFATDSGKIYLDTVEGERLLMGGNSTVFYGTKEISEEEIGSGQKEFYFAINEIENTESGLANSILPAINDLILNQDGCFYRVTDLEYSPEIGELALKTTKLTIAGSGGGGDGTNTGAGKIDFQVIGSLSGTFIYKSPYNISFYFEATDHTGASTGNGTYWVKDITGKTIIEGTAIGGQVTTVDIGSHITTSSLGVPMSLKLYYSGDTGGTSWPVYSRTFSVIPTLFETIWNYDET